MVMIDGKPAASIADYARKQGWIKPAPTVPKGRSKTQIWVADSWRTFYRQLWTAHDRATWPWLQNQAKALRENPNLYKEEHLGDKLKREIHGHN